MQTRGSGFSVIGIEGGTRIFMLVNFLYIFLPNNLLYLVEFKCNDLIDSTMVVLQDGNVFLKRVNICKI